MKAIFCIFSIVFISGQVLSEQNALSDLGYFRKLSKKQSPVELSNKFNTFWKNLREIKSHNDMYAKGTITWKMGVTRFTDMTDEEFYWSIIKDYDNKRNRSRPNIRNMVHPRRYSDETESMDWRDHGVATNVKDMLQGEECASSWAFSATGAMEAQFKIAQGNDIRLSEQMLIDCDHWVNKVEGCSGGSPLYAFLYARTYGIEKEDEYPKYQAKNGECRQKSSKLKISDYSSVQNKNETALKEAVKSIGPISGKMHATENLKLYVEGVFYDVNCKETFRTSETLHVLIIGFGTENRQDYWLIKNSWGEEWGDKGYFKLARNMDNHCGIANEPTYPIVNTKASDNLF